MKYIKTIAVAAGLACAAVTSQAGIVLNFASTSDSTINFKNTGFDFEHLGTPGATSLLITSGSGTSFVGDSVTDTGGISGNFVIGAISGTTATVTGSGTMSIFDGSKTLTGTVTWSSISQSGTPGGLNINGVINLSGISYTGTQVDLKALSNVSAGIETVSFTFSSAETLAQLQAGGISTAFSGTIASTSPVPEPTTVIAGALLLLPFGLSTLRIIRKNSSATVA